MAEPIEAPRLRRATGFGIAAVRSLPHMSDLRALVRAVRGHLPHRSGREQASGRRVTLVLAGLAVVTVAATVALAAAGADGLRGAPLASTTPYLSTPRGGSVVVPDGQNGGGGSRPAAAPRRHTGPARPARPHAAPAPAVGAGHGPAVRRPEDARRPLPGHGRPAEPGRDGERPADPGGAETPPTDPGWALPAGWRFPVRIVPPGPEGGTPPGPPESAGTGGSDPATGYQITVRVPSAESPAAPVYAVATLRVSVPTPATPGPVRVSVAVAPAPTSATPTSGAPAAAPDAPTVGSGKSASTGRAPGSAGSGAGERAPAGRAPGSAARSAGSGAPPAVRHGTPARRGPAAGRRTDRGPHRVS